MIVSYIMRSERHLHCALTGRMWLEAGKTGAKRLARLKWEVPLKLEVRKRNLGAQWRWRWS